MLKQSKEGERSYYQFHVDNGSEEDNMIVYDPVANSKQIEAKIEELTNKVCGGEGTVKIVDEPINLTISSPTCADLTLVDLPGIVQSVGIGQDENIKQITKNMVNRYISSPETVILAVVPANDDEENSIGL